MSARAARHASKATSLSLFSPFFLSGCLLGTGKACFASHISIIWFLVGGLVCVTSGSEGITFRVVGEGCRAQVQHCFWFVRAQELVDAILFWGHRPSV